MSRPGKKIYSITHSLQRNHKDSNNVPIAEKIMTATQSIQYPFIRSINLNL